MNKFFERFLHAVCLMNPGCTNFERLILGGKLEKSQMFKNGLYSNAQVIKLKKNYFVNADMFHDSLKLQK